MLTFITVSCYIYKEKPIVILVIACLFYDGVMVNTLEVQFFKSKNYYCSHFVHKKMKSE